MMFQKHNNHSTGCTSYVHPLETIPHDFLHYYDNKGDDAPEQAPMMEFEIVERTEHHCAEETAVLPYLHQCSEDPTAVSSKQSPERESPPLSPPPRSEEPLGGLSEYESMIREMQVEFAASEQRHLAREEEMRRRIDELQLPGQLRDHCAEKDTEAEDTEKELKDVTRVVLIDVADQLQRAKEETERERDQRASDLEELSKRHHIALKAKDTLAQQHWTQWMIKEKKLMLISSQLQSDLAAVQRFSERTIAELKEQLDKCEGVQDRDASKRDEELHQHREKVESAMKAQADTERKAEENKQLASDAQRELGLLRLELNSIKADLNRAEKSQSENQHFSELLAAQLDDAKAELVRSEESHREEVEALQTDLTRSELVRVKTSLNKGVATMDETAQLTALMILKDNTIMDLQSRLARTRDDSREAKARWDKEREAMDRLVTSDLAAKMEEWEAERQNLTRECQELEETIKNIRKELRSVGGSVLKYDTQVANLENCIQSKDEDYRQYRSNFDRELWRMRDNLAEAERTREEIRADLLRSLDDRQSLEQEKWKQREELTRLREAIARKGLELAPPFGGAA